MLYNTISMYRGDTFKGTFLINFGTEFEPNYYELAKEDKLYVGIREPNALFDDSIIRKTYTQESVEYFDGAIVLTLDPKDTEYLVPGTYYLCAKLLQPANSTNNSSEKDVVTTVLRDTLFYIL